MKILVHEFLTECHLNRRNNKILIPAETFFFLKDKRFVGCDFWFKKVAVVAENGSPLKRGWRGD
jgi:hypothetical protein